MKTELQKALENKEVNGIVPTKMAQMLTANKCHTDWFATNVAHFLE